MGNKSKNIFLESKKHFSKSWKTIFTEHILTFHVYANAIRCQTFTPFHDCILLLYTCDKTAIFITWLLWKWLQLKNLLVSDMGMV